MLVIAKVLHLNMLLLINSSYVQDNIGFLVLHLFVVKEILLLAYFQTMLVSKAVGSNLSPIKGRVANKEQSLHLARLKF